ncbi:MAG: hypothetical protein IRZ16_11160 [Myxococcaceae bacterium]|nr:hypothetical protein [Myxococcaceae bacterium]
MSAKAQLTNEDGVWVIRVPKPNGSVQEFRCASEPQAKKLLAVFLAQNADAPPRRT